MQAAEEAEEAEEEAMGIIEISDSQEDFISDDGKLQLLSVLGCGFPKEQNAKNIFKKTEIKNLAIWILQTSKGSMNSFVILYLFMIKG